MPVNFEEELVEKLNDKEFQAAARQRYKYLAGIVKTSEDMIGRKFAVNDYGHIQSMEETAKQQIYRDEEKCDTISPSELPTRRAGKTIKELTQELQYDLERASDVKTREALIMHCARYIRLERMAEELT